MKLNRVLRLLQELETPTRRVSIHLTAAQRQDLVDELLSHNPHRTNASVRALTRASNALINDRRKALGVPSSRRAQGVRAFRRRASVLAAAE